MMNNNIHTCNDSCPIPSKKYKTIGELKLTSKDSLIQTLSRMEKCPERDYLDKYIFDTHYGVDTLLSERQSDTNINIKEYTRKTVYDNKSIKCKNLTALLPVFNNQICYRTIIKRCFNNNDILANVTIKQILSSASTSFIQELHSISSSLTGTFVDYLIRRIMCEIKNIPFTDHFAKFVSLSNYTLDNDINHVCIPLNNYDAYTVIQLKKICKKNNISGIKYLQKDELIRLIHNHENTCKNRIEKRNTCILPICQKASYKKVKNTTEYPTCDIIADIFIVSLFHSEGFGFAPNQEAVNNIYNIINNKEDINDILISPLVELCKMLTENNTNILLNPYLGEELMDEIPIRIPALADIVLDDVLIDIKCTKSGSDIMEILQLLGYSSLLIVDKHNNRKINTITIMNILRGEMKSYNIEHVDRDQCIKYIELLAS